jgi:hypothetical protein
MLSFTIHCMNVACSRFHSNHSSVCGVKCRVCVALTVLGWPDLAGVFVCCGCSGPLTLRGGGWFMDVRFWGLSGSLWGNIFLRFCVGGVGCFSLCIVRYWDL